MKLELYPKPDKRNIMGRLYKKDNLSKAISIFNEFHSNNKETKGFVFVELGYNEDVNVSINNSIGTILEIFEENGEFYADFKPYDKMDLDDYVLATTCIGKIIDEDNSVEIERIAKVVLIKKSEVEI